MPGRSAAGSSMRRSGAPLAAAYFRGRCTTAPAGSASRATRPIASARAPTRHPGRGSSAARRGRRRRRASTSWRAPRRCSSPDATTARSPATNAVRCAALRSSCSPPRTLLRASGKVPRDAQRRPAPGDRAHGDADRGRAGHRDRPDAARCHCWCHPKCHARCRAKCHERCHAVARERSRWHLRSRSRRERRAASLGGPEALGGRAVTLRLSLTTAPRAPATPDTPDG